MSARIRALSVVMPARDEARLLPAALDALEEARTALEHLRPDVTTEVLVVLDSCVDTSAEIVASHTPRVRALEIDAGSVGAARSAGVAALLRDAAHPPAQHWICTTDADSTVPLRWLLDHLRAAEAGAALALGHVRPRSGDLGESELSRWREDYARTLLHIHGANLGVRADAYRRFGGFTAVVEHEDVSLALRARAAGEAVVLLPESIVTTSGRLEGRTPGGFAGYLRDRCAVPEWS